MTTATASRGTASRLESDSSRSTKFSRSINMASTPKGDFAPSSTSPCPRKK